MFAILLIFYLFRRQCCELFTSVAHLEAFIQVKFELLDRVRGYVEQSERRLHHLERFIERDGNTRPENGDKRAVNVSAAAHAVQLLVTFSRLRKKKRAVFAWLADAQQKRKRELKHIIIETFLSSQYILIFRTSWRTNQDKTQFADLPLLALSGGLNSVRGKSCRGNEMYEQERFLSISKP